MSVEILEKTKKKKTNAKKKKKRSIEAVIAKEDTDPDSANANENTSKTVGINDKDNVAPSVVNISDDNQASTEIENVHQKKNKEKKKKKKTAKSSLVADEAALPKEETGDNRASQISSSERNENRTADKETHTSRKRPIAADLIEKLYEKSVEGVVGEAVLAKEDSDPAIAIADENTCITVGNSNKNSVVDISDDNQAGTVIEIANKKKSKGKKKKKKTTKSSEVADEQTPPLEEAVLPKEETGENQASQISSSEREDNRPNRAAANETPIMTSRRRPLAADLIEKLYQNSVESVVGEAILTKEDKDSDIAIVKDSVAPTMIDISDDDQTVTETEHMHKTKSKGKTKRKKTTQSNEVAHEQTPLVEEDVLPKEETGENRASQISSSASEGNRAATKVKSTNRKRPVAADLIEELNEDSVESVEDKVKSSSSGRLPKRSRAADFIDEATESPDALPKEEEEANEEVKEDTPSASSEAPTSHENQDNTPSEQPSDLGSGLEFLGYSNFDAYSNTLLPSVVEFLKVTKRLPSTKDEYDFYQSYPSFMAFTKNQGQRVLQLIGKIFKHHHVYQAWNTLPSNTVTGIEVQTESVIEANDTLLERVDKILDMLRQDKNENKLEVQQKSSKNVLVAAWNANNNTQQNKPIRLLHSKNILRPQLRWKVKPDNTANPFEPLIRFKPNAKVPLQEVYKDLLKGDHDTSISSFIRSARGRQATEYPHPYLYELETVEPRSWQYELGLKQEPKEVKDTPLTIVDSPDQIPELVRKLGEAKEIAVDLEAHSYRSYLGFTCLMQLSTRTEDFIVDTLSLRTDLVPLNYVFTDPNILKVFHGGSNDILWLQRDLGLYIVNMFDTYHASKQLSLPRCSLSYLLQRYCDVTADKQYQLADWRIRPLPDVMIKYAREDTHFLLYVYDCLRYELLNQGLHTLESVYRNSALECKQTFRKPVFTEESYLDVYDKLRIALKPQQKECLKLVYKWRDQTARNEDESTAFVVPNHMMFKIAELLPPDQEGILACCNPPPPLVRLHVQELHLIVERARHYNPLLDPANVSVNDEEYTPGFLDTTHQQSVESIFKPKLTPARRIKERKEIFYVPKSGPDVKLKNKATIEEDSVSVASETGTISESVSSLQFFDVSTMKSDITDAVRSVTDSMSAPFRLFMSKIEQLRDEEKNKTEKVSSVVRPIQEDIPPEDTEEEVVDSSVIVFKSKNKRPQSEETNELKATTKRRKKTVGDIQPFSYEEITMSTLAEEEDVKPLIEGNMLNQGEQSRATSIKKRTSIKAGNRSSFQNFLKNKFKR